MIGLIIGGICAIADLCCKIAAVKMVAVKMVADAICKIAQSLGLIKTDKPEELGDKALQAAEAGIKPENFEDYDAYVKAIEKFEIDPEKSNKYTPEEKQKKGMEVAACSMMGELGAEVVESLLTLALTKSNLFTVGRFDALGKICATDKAAVKILVDVLSNRDKSDASISKAMDILTSMEKAENPALSAAEARRQARAMRR